MTSDVEFTSVSPVIVVRDLDLALDRYRRMGFTVHAYDGGERYGYADRGSVSLHLTEWEQHNPEHDGAVVYIYVSDADALHARWKADRIEGRFQKPHDTPYGLREFAFVDPDGTAHRIGSPLSK